MLVELKGQIERITFSNEENGFTVAQLKVRGQRHLVTIVGHLMCPKPGERLRLQGEWSLHPKYGEQFKFVDHETLFPATDTRHRKISGIRVLSKVSDRLWPNALSIRFAAETFEIIDNRIERLTEVSGIGSKRLEMIRLAWEEQKQIREVMLFLTDS